ncbi:MAG: PIG-L family deacetylase [Candidatus Marinimicrobia bacterium]|nr:PIG-L family deacetylase [Candidatus Neomarinimicrobiota bacterium]
MIIRKHKSWITLFFLFSTIPILFECESKKPVEEIGEKICVILAHPDDETMVSGTLALLSTKGCDIRVVYVTSGDDGPDETGQGLHGESLAKVREQEAEAALQALGIQQSPIFLKVPDGHVSDRVDDLKDALLNLLADIEPVMIIGFGPDGMTGDWDHTMTGLATDVAFDLTDSGKLLLHMAQTERLIPISETSVFVSELAVDLRVNVADYTAQRVHAFDAHHTQFPRRARIAYKVLAHTRKTEEFIISRNRNAENFLRKYFDAGTLKK